MRTFLVSLLLVASLVMAASAEMLVTANPLGQGKFGFELAGLQDQNLSGQSSLNMMSYGGYVGYGLLENLDAYLQLGMSNVGGLPSGFEGSMTSYGLNLKYTVLNEGAAMPVSVALGAGYKAMNITSKNPFTGSSTDSGNQMGIAAGVSKILAPFVPYGAVAYKKTTQAGADVSSQMDVTVGTAIAWSMQGAVLLEYTMQQVTPAAAGTASYSSGQIAAGVSYALR